MLNKIQKSGSNVSDFLKSWIKTFSAGLAIISLLILFTIPFLSQERDYQVIFLGYVIRAMIFSILAASWDFLAGISGQINFGQAAFFGVGGYVYAYYISYQGLPMLSSILIGTLYAVIIGILIGAICLRVKGPYLALVTLALGVIFLRLFLSESFSDIFYGTGGIPNLPDVFSSPAMEYLTVLILLILTMIILIGLSKSKFGTILKAIRDDETGAQSSGINTNKYKLLAFTISSFFAGLAGALFAINIGTVTPTNNFGTTLSFYPIVMASLGGLGTIVGGALGAFLFLITEYIIKEIVILRFNASLEFFGINFLDVYLLFAFILLAIILFAKRGLLKPIIEKLKKTFDLVIGR